jgi:glycosyltransferase involved in cell wall biosynthesis
VACRCEISRALLAAERWVDMDGRHRDHRIDRTADDHAPTRLAGQGKVPAGRAERSSRSRDEGAVSTPSQEIVILIPAFNDWQSLARLLPRIDSVLAAHDTKVDVLIVDDGSTSEPEGLPPAAPYRALRRVDVLRLRRNLGHQRAIAVGLSYVEDCLNSSVVVVMDGDGEDDPADVPRLLEQLEHEGNRKIVFAERSRRSESIAFRLFYALYKLAHLALTGKRVRIGNFSAIPRRRLSSLVVVSDLWNHYAAAVIRSRQPHCMIPTCRAGRLCGRSTMNFVSLVVHGLSAISVYSDVVGVRLLVMSALMALVTLSGIVAAVIVRLTTNWAVPGWASYTVGILVVLLVQAMMAAFVFSFMILGSRHGSSFLPRRDYSYFIGSLRTLEGPERSASPLPSSEPAGEVLTFGG